MSILPTISCGPEINLDAHGKTGDTGTSKPLTDGQETAIDNDDEMPLAPGPTIDPPPIEEQRPF